MQKKTDYQELLTEIIEFNRVRGWEPYQNPKDLALSINLEASELLENFQWKSSDEAVAEKLQNIKEEVADVFIYLLHFTNTLDLDLIEITKEKIAKNALKYPVPTE